MRGSRIIHDQGRSVKHEPSSSEKKGTTAMIRVLQFADLVNRYDFIDNIVQRADRERFEVGICVRTSECNIEAPVLDPGTPRWVLNGVSRSGIPRAVWQLAALLRRWRADVLHTHHYDQAVIGWLATRVYPRTRLVVGRHYSDAIYRSARGWKRKGLLVLEQAVNRAAARVIVPSNFIRDLLTQRQRVAPDKIDLVPYGFVPEKYAGLRPEDVQRVRTELGLEGRLVLGNFARLHEEKGQRILIEALASLRPRLPQLTLVIVGEGPERGALEAQVRDRGLDDVVKFLGWRRDSMTLMAAVDVVVQPTLQEAFSQVMAEALWMGKPLVITDVSGAPDIIRHGHNGLIVPRGDAPALAQAVERLLTDDALRARVAREGKAFVSANLDMRTIIEQYERSYELAIGVG
jgi:glycosyltransferase involved in cell wall biosynthesis